MPKNTISFEEYYKNLEDKTKKKMAVEFVKKYTPLMSEGDRSQFDIGEKPLSVTEALNTKDASVLITKVVEGALEQAAEPMYIGTKFFDIVNIDSGNRVVFPALGELVAEEMNEGDEYRNQAADINMKEKITEVSVKKHGIMVPITQEMVEDSLWSVLSLHVKAAGRAMGRLREEKALRAMLGHGHVVFDNNIRDKEPDAGTTGRNEMGEYNNTLALEDFLDIVIAQMINGNTPTHTLIHPLTWTVFMKNGMMDMFDAPALGGTETIGSISTDASQGRLPVGMNILSTPFMPINKEDKKFHIVVLDENNVGAIVEREKMTTDQFDDPYRDIINLKCKSRYGVGVYNSGKGISVAKNISLEPTYRKPMLVRTIDVTGQ